MTDDDDLLAVYDLSAWEAPPPAPGLVDAVIERAREPAAVGALESGERTAARGNKRWWIAATAVSVAVVAIAIGVWGVQRTPANGQGEVTAMAARTLAIGPTTAALDPGVHVGWRRDKHKISVAQPRGTAMWNVAAEDTLVIDAGAMVATVEASGASLRVEVKMINASDARAIRVSAATAVAVALVTIVVYEGTVRVRHDGQTVNVVPGAHYEVRPPGAPEPIAVGGGPVDPRLRELEDKLKEVEAERDALNLQVNCDEVSCVLTNYDGACCEKLETQNKTAAPPSPCDADALRKKGDDHVATGMYAAALAAFESSMRCRPDPELHAKAFLAACQSKNQSKARSYFAKLPEAKQTSLKAICMRNGIDPAPACDADALRAQGDDHLSTGMDEAALAAFEKSYACNADPSVPKKAFLAACRAKKAAAAQKHYSLLPANDRASLAQLCIRNGIHVQEPTGKGVIKIASTPPARILLDGVNTGKTTPMTLDAIPGKHKVTFMIGDDKYTFNVTVKDGETVSLTKQLE